MRSATSLIAVAALCTACKPLVEADPALEDVLAIAGCLCRGTLRAADAAQRLMTPSVPA